MTYKTSLLEKNRSNESQIKRTKGNTSQIQVIIKYSFSEPKFSERLPVKSSKINSTTPIRINMSRSSIKKKQLEIMNEYNMSNNQKLINNLRKIQQDIDDRVKQFTQKNF